MFEPRPFRFPGKESQDRRGDYERAYEHHALVPHVQRFEALFGARVRAHLRALALYAGEALPLRYMPTGRCTTGRFQPHYDESATRVVHFGRHYYTGTQGDDGVAQHDEELDVDFTRHEQAAARIFDDFRESFERRVVAPFAPRRVYVLWQACAFDQIDDGDSGVTLYLALALDELPRDCALLTREAQA